jgi:hypothetical protein
VAGHGADEGAEEVRACQPISEQTLEDAPHELQLTGVFLSHPKSLAGLGCGVPTLDERERRIGVIPQEEPLFTPSSRRVGDRAVEVWVNSRPGADIDVYEAPHCRFCIRIQP